MPSDTPEENVIDFYVWPQDGEYTKKGDVDIYKKVSVGRNRRTWQRHLLVRTSRHGKGLFAARDFQANEYIGRYVGKVIGNENNPADIPRIDAAGTRSDALVSMHAGPSYSDVITVDGKRDIQSDNDQIRRIGYVLFDKAVWTWPGYHLHYANDPRGSDRRSNMQVYEEGYTYTKHRIPAYVDGQSLAYNEKSELLYSYGDNYWNESEASRPPTWYVGGNSSNNQFNT